MTINRVLDELADREQPLLAGRLTRLNRLTAEEREELAGAWPSLPLERRRQVISNLMMLAEDNVELDFDAIFMQALGDDDAEVRAGAIQALWEHTDRDVIPHLLQILAGDPSPSVRAEAAAALGRFVLLGEFEEARPSDVQAITTALRAVLADGGEPVELRARAVEALGASSQPWVRDLIHDAFDSGEDRMAPAAIRAMGRNSDTYWLPTLFTELQSGDPELRFEAAAACGEIEDEEAVPYLAELLDDEDGDVREQAILALGEIGGEEAVAVLRMRQGGDDERMEQAIQQALEEAEFGDDPLGFEP